MVAVVMEIGMLSFLVTKEKKKTGGSPLHLCLLPARHNIMHLCRLEPFSFVKFEDSVHMFM